MGQARRPTPARGAPLAAGPGRAAPPPAPVAGLALPASFAAAQAAAAILSLLAQALLAPRGGGAAARAVLAVRLAYTVGPAALLAAAWSAVHLSGRVRPGALCVWPGGRAVAAGVAAGVALKLCGDAVAALLQLFGGPLAANNPLLLYGGAFAAPGWRALLAVGVVALAPAGEELFFRGMLYGWLRRRLARAPAVVLGGLFFGLAHLSAGGAGGFLGGLALVAPLACVGCGLCLLYEGYRSLWVSGTAHATLNLCSLLAALWWR